MWLASVGSIVVISLVGLLAVAALPLLRGKHRKAALQVLEMVVMVLVLVVTVVMLMLVLEVMLVALVMLMLVVSVKVTMEKNQHVAKKCLQTDCTYFETPTTTVYAHAVCDPLCNKTSTREAYYVMTCFGEL